MTTDTGLQILRDAVAQNGDTPLVGGGAISAAKSLERAGYGVILVSRSSPQKKVFLINDAGRAAVREATPKKYGCDIGEHVIVCRPTPLHVQTDRMIARAAAKRASR